MNAKFKLRIFISSMCNDKGKYDKTRMALKKKIEATGLAEVYLFGDAPRTVSAYNDYTWNVADADLCIFIIDNKDGVSEGVQNEIDIAKKHNIKSFYYFCSQFSNEQTSLQKSLFGPGNPKYNEISSFDELIENGTQHLVDEIVSIYHNFCRGRLREYNGEIEMSSSVDNISDYDTADEKYLPKISLNNIDKSCDYILSKTIGNVTNRRILGKETKTSELDDCELDFLELMMGERAVGDYSQDVFLRELERLQTPECLIIVKMRWKAIGSYFRDDINTCIDELENAYRKAEELKVSAWILQDILIDIRNIRMLKGNIDNAYSFEAQKKLDEFKEQFHYPVLDRINVTIEEKYVKGLYKKKLDSPNTVYLGSDYSEFGQLFASALLLAMYNGSLTHIRLFYDRIKEFMFYLSEKYSDWVIRKNLLKYAIVSADEKEITHIIEAYPEFLLYITAEDAKDIMIFCDSLPIAAEKMKAKIQAFGVVGNYLSDDQFSYYENELEEYIIGELKQERVSYLLGRIVFNSFTKISQRINAEKLIEICLCVIKKGYSAWYMELFKFIEQVDLSEVSDELRKRLIIATETLLYEEKEVNALFSGVLVHIRNSDTNNTDRLDSIIKEKFPHYYYDSYLIDTCNGTPEVIADYINKLTHSIESRNIAQGRNGFFSGYARRDYLALRIVLSKYSIPDNSTLKGLFELAKQTICESHEMLTTKLDAVEFIVFLLDKRPEFCNYFRSDIEEMFIKRKQILIGDQWEFTNVSPVALEFGLILLKSIVSNDDEYYEMIETLAIINAHTATLISIVSMLRRFYECERITLSARIDASLLTYVLQWLMNDNLVIRWNSCRILFGLSQRMSVSHVAAKTINELMEHDCVYIKILILNNLDSIKISENSKNELLRKATYDANYLVREKAKLAVIGGDF